MKSFAIGALFVNIIGMASAAPVSTTSYLNCLFPESKTATLASPFEDGLFQYKNETPYVLMVYVDGQYCGSIQPYSDFSMYVPDGSQVVVMGPNGVVATFPADPSWPKTPNP